MYVWLFSIAVVVAVIATVIATVVAIVVTIVTITIFVMVTVVTTIAIAIVTSISIVVTAVVTAVATVFMLTSIAVASIASRFLSRLFSRLACYSVVIGFSLVAFSNRLFSLWCNDVGITICDSFFSVFFCGYSDSYFSLYDDSLVVCVKVYVDVVFFDIVTKLVTVEGDSVDNFVSARFAVINCTVIDIDTLYDVLVSIDKLVKIHVSAFWHNDIFYTSDDTCVSKWC